MVLLLSIAIFIFLLFFCLNLLYKRTNFYKNYNIALADYDSNMPDNIKLAVFGSTYAKFAFNSIRELNLNAMNFALDAECLECDQEILEQYSKRLEPGCIVIITLGACAACSKEDEIVCINPRYYYHLLDNKRIPSSILTIKNIIKYHFPLVFQPKCVKYIIFDCKEFKNFTDSYPYECDKEKRKWAMQSLVDVWLKMFKLKNLQDYNLSEEIKKRVNVNIEVLNRLVHTTISRGYRPVLVVTPMSGFLNSFYSDQFIDKTLIRLCRSVQLDYNIPFLDYRTHEDFQFDETMFLDGGFRMSSKGSIHFIKMVFRDLREYGYILNNKTLQK